jgi:short-subunit dehydrogenase
MQNFKNKIVWITGASSGIGEALVRELAKQDCKLIISARREEELKRVRTEAKLSDTECAILPFDLANYNQMDTVAAKAIAFYGSIDILINNGGISQRSLIVDTTIAVDEKMMQINYLGTVALTKAILPTFIVQQKGHFVTVTSLMGRFGSPYRSGYCGAKHALHGFFDVLRMEHEKDGIAVSLVCPGFVQTNVSVNALTGDGSSLGTMDQSTAKGITAKSCATSILKAIKKKKFEAYIGGKEIYGIYVKRFYPRLLHKLVIKSEVR